MKNRIKSILKYIVCILCATVTLTGCSILPSLSDSGAVTDSEYVTIGGHLTVHNTDTRLTLLDNIDVLSADGLYYASWVSGDSKPYENSDGDTVDLYDAQLYLLMGEFRNPDTAEKNMESWLAAGQTNYDITDEVAITCNGQSYTVIIYNFQNEENPYSHGVSAFGVHEDLAVCVELTCREDYQEDLQEMLTDFLDSCTFQ